MKEEKFKVIQFIREFIKSVEDDLDNFPKKNIETKVRIRANSYDLLEVCYEANTLENEKLKIDLLLKAIAKIKTIDFLLDLSRERNLIANKRYLKLSAKLDDIIKYLNGWLKAVKAVVGHN